MKPYLISLELEGIMNKTKLLEEIFQDDEKLEIYLNEIFLNPPLQDNDLINQKSATLAAMKATMKLSK